MFWDKLIELCEENNLKPNNVGKELNISSASFTKWKNGAIPNAETLMRIADFFNVTVDYLLGRTENITSVNINTVSGSHNTFQNGNDNIARGSDNYFSNPAVARAYESLTEKEKLEIQIAILDKAAASEKSNATVTEIKKEEASPGWGETSYK